MLGCLDQAKLLIRRKAAGRSRPNCSRDGSPAAYPPPESFCHRAIFLRPPYAFGLAALIPLLRVRAVAHELNER